MKSILLFFCLLTFSLQSMQQSLFPGEKHKDPFFKELRMQLRENPEARTIIKTCGGILFVFGLFRPWVALGTATAAALSTLAAYYRDRENDIQERKKAKDEIAYMAFANGPKALIEQVCQTDEYLQTDYHSLRNQNTAYLIYILEQLPKTSSPTIKANYQKSVAILANTHADLESVHAHFERYPAYANALASLPQAERLKF